MFNFTLQNVSGSLIVNLEGDLDIEATEIIEEELIVEIQNSAGEVELNFQNIDFVDSSGIGLLISIITELKGNDRNPTITNISEDVKTVFTLLQLDEILGKDVVLL
ncbi:STAS domain-containing protein [Ureibacillus chungkukjangi]|uniref:STAS domain-containing protein n=1 Tax=Ureibacillus chungkukjangi TaxID=1202712 RepID=UPI00203C6CBD|nr:STAS domain-containing protein [Ureibacillus chungkukjangi]MCM3390372.1 STAS domain-containing protein [Ureibacillus chungkukjangi]